MLLVRPLLMGPIVLARRGRQTGHHQLSDDTLMQSALQTDSRFLTVFLTTTAQNIFSSFMQSASCLCFHHTGICLQMGK